MPEPDYSGLVDLARQRADLLADQPSMPDWARGRGAFLNALAGSVQSLGTLIPRARTESMRFLEGDPEASIKPVIDVSTAAFTGGLPMAARGAAGIFGGRLAANADRTALRQAEDMAAKGADPREIYQRTGWFKGADGEWRFEISDARASYKPPGAWENIMRETRAKAGELPPSLSQNFTHAELEKAYPGLLDSLKLNLFRSKGALLGGINEKADTIFLNTRSPRAEAKSTLLHELQHVVQQREGFGPGGSQKTPEIQGLSREAVPGFQRVSGDFVADVERQITDYMALRRGAGDSQMSDYNLRSDFWRNNPKLKEEYEAARKMVEEPSKAMSEAQFQAYQRIAGETEARNVQQRMNMPKEQRRRVMPWETESYPAEGQVVIPAPQRVLPF